MTAFISPIEPTETKSSKSSPVLVNLRAMYTTSRKLCSINLSCTDLSPLDNFSIKKFSSVVEYLNHLETEVDQAVSIFESITASSGIKIPEERFEKLEAYTFMNLDWSIWADADGGIGSILLCDDSDGISTGGQGIVTIVIENSRQM